MKKQLPVGLVVEGSSANSALLELPRLANDLGPIKSTALRVARRLSNFLRAGHAVSSYEELQLSRLILIHVPDASVPRIIHELLETELNLKGLAFVLAESWLTSDSLEGLRSLGASVATLVSVPSIHRRWFIVEGDTPAVRQVRRLLEQNDGTALQVRNGTKGLYFTAELLATVLPIPLYSAAQYVLREAGISGNHLHTILQEMSQKMFKDFSNGARARHAGPLSELSPGMTHTHLATMRRDYPQLAEFVDEQLAQTERSLFIKSRPA